MYFTTKYMDQKTIEYYNSKAIEWSNTHFTPRFWAHGFDDFQKALSSGRIIEIGCGGGRDAMTLVEMGYDYLGIDPAEKLLEEAQKNNPGQSFQVLDVFALEKEKLGEFDGFWSAATLLHIPKKKVSLALEKIKSVLKPGGIGFISLKEGKGEERLAEAGLERFFAYYSDKEFRKKLQQAGFSVIKFSHLPMARTKWLMYIVKAA